MADSDDEYDRRRDGRGREKFRRERNDYERSDDRRRDSGGTGSWSSRGGGGGYRSRDRGSGRGVVNTRDPYGRDYDNRRDHQYSPPHGRDGSPPQMKRMRRDDGGGGGGYYGGRGGGRGAPPHNWGDHRPDMGGGPPQHGHFDGGGGPALPVRPGAPEIDFPTQPPMMTFKQFLAQQEDDISDQDAIKHYNNYKVDFQRQQINKFFLEHKEEEWFRVRYHPEECIKRKQELRDALGRRLEVYLELANLGFMESLTVDMECGDGLVRLLDAAVLKLEGGTENDMRILDHPELEDEPEVKPEESAHTPYVVGEKKKDEKKDPVKSPPEEPMAVVITKEQEALQIKAKEFSQTQKAAEDAAKEEEKKGKKRKRDQTEYSYDDSGSDSESGSGSDEDESGSDSEDEPAPPGMDGTNDAEEPIPPSKAKDPEPLNDSLPPGMEPPIPGLEPAVPGLDSSVHGLEPTIPSVEPIIPGLEATVPGLGPTIPGMGPELPPGTESKAPPAAVLVPKPDSESGEPGEIEENEEAGEIVEKEDVQGTEEKEVDTAAAKSDKVDDRPKPRALHRTQSIFLRNLVPSITKLEVDGFCQRYPGFVRVTLQDPVAERHFFRRGWVTFERHVNIKDICWNLNNIRVRECELNAIVNRELKQRVRPVNGITVHRTVLKNDIKYAAKIVQNLDNKWSLWEDPQDEKSDKSKEEPTFGLVSKNPVLRNITDFLVEEGNFEEEELLGTTIESIETADSNEITCERDEPLIKALDRMILYLRIVHSIDYYSATEFPNEDEMPHRCGIMHARGIPPPSSKLAQSDINDWIGIFEQKIRQFADFKRTVLDEEADKLGRKNPEAEVEKFITANTQELAKDKWLCPLSGKKFKGPDFVRKHIFTKHEEKIDEVKCEVSFFNNYLVDPKRPQLPEHPGNKRLPPPYGGGPDGHMGGGYRGPPPPDRMGYQGRGHMRGGYGNGPPRSNYQKPYGGGGRDNFRHDPPRRNYVPRSSFGRGRSDPRNIIEYRDLDAPEDMDMFS